MTAGNLLPVTNMAAISAPPDEDALQPVVGDGALNCLVLV
jgi:hypothetical protein